VGFHLSYMTLIFFCDFPWPHSMIDFSAFVPILPILLCNTIELRSVILMTTLCFYSNWIVTLEFDLDNQGLGDISKYWYIKKQLQFCKGPQFVKGSIFPLHKNSPVVSKKSREHFWHHIVSKKLSDFHLRSKQSYCCNLLASNFKVISRMSPFAIIVVLDLHIWAIRQFLEFPVCPFDPTISVNLTVTV